MHLTKCYGNQYAYHHNKQCRPGRPLCKKARRAAGQETCECPAYRFVHRKGSGECYYGKKAIEAAMASEKACA